MTDKQKLEKALERAFSGYPGSFIYEIEHEYTEDNVSYYHVSLKHNRFGKEYHFPAVVNGDECCIDYSEDYWQDINAESMFIWMWFEEVEEREIG